MEESSPNENIDAALYLAAYRTVINPKLFHLPFAASNYLLAHEHDYPTEFWTSGLDSPNINFGKRVRNVSFCSHASSLAESELYKIRGSNAILQQNDLFNQNIDMHIFTFTGALKQSQQEYREQYGELEKKSKILVHRKEEFGDSLSILESLEIKVANTLKSLSRLVQALGNTKSTLGIQYAALDSLVYVFYASDNTLEPMILRYASANAEIQGMIGRRISDAIDLYNTDNPVVHPNPFSDGAALELKIFKENIDSVLGWLLEKSRRFSVLRKEYSSMKRRSVWQVELISKQVSDGSASKKINSLMRDYENASWLLETIQEKLVNLNWILLFTNYILNYAIEITYHGMSVFKDFSTACSSELEQGAKSILRWSRKDNGVTLTQTGDPVDVTKAVRDCYRLIVRACYIVSQAWHFEPIKATYQDQVWLEESHLVSETYSDSLDKTNVIERRGGINFRIKRSNIREAGLGLFFDDDINSLQDPNALNKFEKGEWGLPILIYDGEYMPSSDTKILYGGSDSLRPYSVGTSANLDQDLDAYNAQTSDIARFLNDPFNRLPELGLEPDTTNPDISKRSFVYTAYFLWCKIPEKSPKAGSGRSPFSKNDETVNYLRTRNDSSLQTSTTHQHGYALAIYTMPLKKLPSMNPKSLFQKGQELWIQYGYDYIRRISSMTRARNVDYKYEELGAFVSSKRSQYDITLQENIQKFLQFQTTNSKSTDKEYAKNTLERMIVVTNMLSFRPFTSTDNFYTYALDQIANCCLKDIVKESMEWMQRASVRELTNPEDYVSFMLRGRIFDEKKIRRDLNNLNKDVPMDCIVSILSTVTACYYSCILQIIDKKIKLVPEEIEDADEGCDDLIATVTQSSNVRIPGMEKLKIGMDMFLELLKETSTKWHVRQEPVFDESRWEKLFKMFRIDLDTMIEELKVSGVSFEDYKKTKEYIEKSELGSQGTNNVKFIGAVIEKAVKSTETKDYIEDVEWLMSQFSGDEKILSLLRELFTQETLEFQAKTKERMRMALLAMKNLKKLSDLALDFTQPDIDVASISLINVGSVLATAWAFVTFSQETGALEKFPWKAYNNVQKMLDAIKTKNRELFYPRWVYEIDSRDTGKMKFLEVFNSRISSLSMQPSSAPHKIMKEEKSTRYISLDLTLELKLNIGNRFRGDNYPRYGYVAELFVSKELGPNFEIVRKDLAIEGQSVKKKQTISVSFGLIENTEALVSVDGRYIPLQARAKYSTVGLYIKGTIKPFDSGRVTSHKFRLDYEGECYIPIADKNLTGRKLPILCKNFQIDTEYEVIGYATVDSCKTSIETEFIGEYSEADVESSSKLAENLINGFFALINSEEMGHHPQESFLRNKHTPIWPNTPLRRLPSSLFVLNIPLGDHAYNGYMNFSRCLTILCSAYGIDVETQLKSSLKLVCEYKPNPLVKNEVVLHLYAVLRLIGEAVALIPDLCDYKSDYAKDGSICENYGEGTDGIDDCESNAKLGFSIGYSMKQMNFQEGTTMWYIQYILQSYVDGLVDCSTSKAASRGEYSDVDVRPEYRGKIHINHVPAALLPIKNFCQMCARSDKFSSTEMKVYKERRWKRRWYDDYLQPLVVEGTGNTIPLMATCENLLEDVKVKSEYCSWAKSFLQTHYTIFTKFEKLSQLGFQDNSALKFVEGVPKDKHSFSNFYTKWVHFWTPDLALNGGPLVTDFLFCYPGNISQGSKTKWVYGVDFYDFIHKSNTVALYPAIKFTKEQFSDFSAIASTQVHPPNIPPIDKLATLVKLDSFVAPQRVMPGQSVIGRALKDPVLGVLSQKQIVAYSNHLELYEEKKEEIRMLVEGGMTDIVKCEVYHCRINDIADMVQFVFHLS